MRAARMGSCLQRAPAGTLPLRPGGLWQGRRRRATGLLPAAVPAEAVQQGTTIAEIFAGGGPQALLQGLEQLLSVPPAEAYTGAAVAAAAAGGPVVPNALTKISLMLVALAAAAQARDGPADADSTSPAAAAGAGAASQQHSSSADQVPLTYDPEALSAYFRRRPMLVLKRNAVVLSKVASFLGSLAADWRLGKWDANMPMRAQQCVAMLESLGPAFVKIGQATSTRVDVLPEPYLEQLQKLQDKVQVFSSAEARRVLEEELGRPISEVFEWLSDEPVASASLGQVYRGKLLEGGQEVAVKVQRPGVLEGAALDIHLMRRALHIYCSMPGAEPEWATVLDEWALRFFGELDYEQEADNTIQFKQQMAHLQGVTVAEIHPELTSRKVLVMSWVSGQRLADVPAADVRPLCTTLLNCYLIQLLETGLLHADPHPGNLMMAPDGKLVVLDFGLMTAVSEEQRIALVEFITNLTMGDWPGVVRDMMRLGFLPHGLPAGQTEEDVAPLMQRVLGPLVAGGGIGGIDAFALHCEMDALAKEFRLVLPPYFTLVLRAFSTIEGIALKASPNYSIVAECMPYLSRRLLSDRDPRMRAALKHLLYGNQSRLDLARLVRMVTAFGAFSTAAASPSPQQQQPQQPQPSAAMPTQQQPQRRQLARQQQQQPGSGGVFPDPFAVAGALFALPAALLGTALASESPFPSPASLAASAAQGLIGQLPGLPLGLSPAGRGFGSGLAGAAAAAAAAYPGAAGLLPAPAAVEEPVVSDSMKEVLQIVFSPDGSFVQELLVDELAAGVDALGREALFEAFSIVASGISGASGLRSSQGLGPLTNLVLPPLPLLRSAQQVLTSLAPPVFLTPEDELTLSNIRTLVSLVTGSGLAAGSTSSSEPSGAAPGLGGPRVYLQAARELAPLVPSLMPGVQATLELFVRQLARRLALRLAADLDPAGAAAATAAAAALEAPPAPAGGGRGISAAAGAGPAAGAQPPRVARH